MINALDILGFILPLHKARIDDLDSREQYLRDLHERINILEGLLELLVDLQSDRFSGNEEVLAKIKKFLGRSKEISNEITRKFNREQQNRDQVHAQVIEWQATVDKAGKGSKSSDGEADAG